MLGDLLRELLGAGQAKPAMKKGAKMKPMKIGGASRRMTPSQRDFPGETNYGVPEDNMIDTKMGYIQPQQYDQLVNSSQGERGYLNPLQGAGSMYRPMNQNFVQQGGFDPMRSAVRMQYGAQNQFEGGQNPLLSEDFRNRLRVR